MVTCLKEIIYYTGSAFRRLSGGKVSKKPNLPNRGCLVLMFSCFGLDLLTLLESCSHSPEKSSLSRWKLLKIASRPHWRTELRAEPHFLLCSALWSGAYHGTNLGAQPTRGCDNVFSWIAVFFACPFLPDVLQDGFLPLYAPPSSCHISLKTFICLCSFVLYCICEVLSSVLYLNADMSMNRQT